MPPGSDERRDPIPVAPEVGDEWPQVRSRARENDEHGIFPAERQVQEMASGVLDYGSGIAFGEIPNCGDERRDARRGLVQVHVRRGISGNDQPIASCHQSRVYAGPLPECAYELP